MLPVTSIKTKTARNLKKKKKKIVPGECTVIVTSYLNILQLPMFHFYKGKEDCPFTNLTLA